MALSIEMALLPEETEAREAYVADALEALARGLDAEKRRDIEAFELGRGNLTEVAFRFDPVARNVSAKLSDDGTKLVVGTSRPGTPPVTSEDYAYLFRKRADERRRARYASKRADEVPPNEREAYFLSLRRLERRPPRAAPPPRVLRRSHPLHARSLRPHRA